jgi:hypothetical protein
MMLKRMRNAALLAALLTGTVAVGMQAAAGQDDAKAQARIENAMSAGPSVLAKDATILDSEAVDDAGKFVVLRQGSNGWYCFPDLSYTPGNDPQCIDQTWLDWNYAYLAKKAPSITTPGLEYMLQGGSDPSNTDPFATEPAAGEEWMSTPPHVMIILPGKLDQSVFSTDPDSGKPWIMWAGTPYEHIMMPVADGGTMP